MRVLLAVFSVFLFSCGVKAPPIAMQRPPEVKEKRLNCLPTDPECDVEDPNYKPVGK